MLFKSPPRLVALSALARYLQTNLWNWMKDLSTGLVKLNFLENFATFRIDNLLIDAGAEVAIPNGLKNRYIGVIPSSRIVVRQQGNGVVTDGSQPWTSDLVYLKNEGAVPITISVIFFQ